MDYLQYYASFTISAFVIVKVLNLIINGLPSILKTTDTGFFDIDTVLNLIINGLPSIHNLYDRMET